MTVKPLDKLYSQLSPEEQATLVFDAVTRQDEKEADAILASVPWLHYKSIHADYRRRVVNLVCLAQYYAQEHFRARAMLFESYKYYQDSDFSDEYLSSIFHTAYQRLANLEEALNRLGKEHHVDTQAVKRFSGCPGITNPEHLADAEEDGIEEAYEGLSRAMAFG
jgi:hypothetical protein